MYNNDGLSLFDHNKQLLSDYVEFHEDDSDAFENSINNLIDAGVGKIKEIQYEEGDTFNWAFLIINDEDRVFYTELTEYGNIAVLRANGPGGEILQAVTCGFEEIEDQL